MSQQELREKALSYALEHNRGCPSGAQDVVSTARIFEAYLKVERVTVDASVMLRPGEGENSVTAVRQ